jgi:thioredoxin 1
MGKAIEITDANFEQEVISADVPVLIDFWAVWCNPCKIVAPIVEQIATEYSGKLKVGKLDVDNNRQTAMNYGIRSIPTLLVFNRGKVVAQIIGAASKTHLLEKLEPHLA